MDTGKTVKIIRNVPAPIPVEIPTPKKNGEDSSGDPIPIELPVRKEEVVES